MTIKYFYYISETKVNLIQSQLHSFGGISEINPKIEFGGFGVSFGVKPNPDDNVVTKVVNLLSQMSRKNLLIPLPSVAGPIDAIEEFYKDESVWRSGIISYSKSNQSGNILDAYILWRLYGDTLVLLLGSPNHIVGEHSSSDNIHRVLTYGLSDFFLKTVGRLTASLEHTVPDGWDIEKYPNGASLAAFCVSDLPDLPQRKIDLAFKVFQKLDFNIPNDLPFWFSHLYDLPENERKPFERCRSICIGSPLYTALL